MARNTLPYYEDQLRNLFIREKSTRDFFPGEDSFSPQIWRLNLNGTRQFVQYGSITGFTDNPDDFTIEPQAATDTFTLETTEIFRYYPRIPTIPTFNFQTNQSLQSGDKVTLAWGDADLQNGMTDASGWILEFVPGIGDDEVYFSIYRNGTIVSNGGSRKRIGLERNITDWREFAIMFHASVGSGVLKETYTNDSGFQDNVVQAHVGSTTGRGPENASNPIQYSVTGGGNGLQLQVGSTSIQSIGRRSDKERAVRLREDFRMDNGDQLFRPLFAFRNTERDLTLSFTDLKILDFSGSADMELEIRSFSPINLTYGTGAWGSPRSLRAIETAIEVRDDVTDFPDNSGAIVQNLDPTTDDIGGYQLGLLSWVQGGPAPPHDYEQKLHYRDVAVVFGRGRTAGDIELLATVNQSR